MNELKFYICIKPCYNGLNEKLDMNRIYQGKIVYGYIHLKLKDSELLTGGWNKDRFREVETSELLEVLYEV